MMEEIRLDLRLFDGNPNTQTTLLDATGNDLSPEMKTFYDKVLLKNAVPNLIHDQFGQKKPIPKGGGKEIEFRRYTPFPKATTPITEGVTPDGHALDVQKITAEVTQYGDYVTLSDVLILTAIDDNIVAATELLGNQAGETLDWVTREKMAECTNILRVGGYNADNLITANDKLTVNAIKKGVRQLKRKNAKKIDKYYVGIVCPDTAYDLMCDPEWISASEYAGSGQIFEGEIGKIAGVRFVETTEAKVFQADGLTAAARNLTVRTASTSSTTLAVAEAISADEATALAGRKILIGTDAAVIASATAGAAGSASLTLKTAGSYAKDAVIYPGEAGAGGIDVYATFIIGANAYGVTEVEGGGLQQFTKQLGSSGTADPLNQRATVGWKALKTAEILNDFFMVMIKSAASND